MVKLSEEEFCKYIEHMKAAWDADSTVAKIARECKSDFLGSDLSYLLGDMCELLEKLMDTEYEDVSYFCINEDFGREKDAEFDSPEDLYRFLVEESERKNEKGKL